MAQISAGTIKQIRCDVYYFVSVFSGRKVERMAVVLRWEAVSSRSTPTGKPVRFFFEVCLRCLFRQTALQRIGAGDLRCK